MTKFVIFILVFFFCSTAWAGEIRQRPFPDVYGHTQYVYTDDDGNTTTIKQKPFTDVYGNTVYEVDQN